MYRVLYKNELLFDPYVEETAITDAKLTQEVNSSAYFDFTISPKHPLYDTVAEREGSVKLYYDAEKLFEGEITKIETDIYGCKSITCVSALDYLNDTCVRPYSTVKSEGLDLVPPSSVNGYFQWLIDQHNEHVLDASKTFTVGVNQGEYFTGGAFIYRSSESYSSTADEIQSNILDVFGGYLFLRYDGENAVLDLYSDVHEANTQIIDFGVNITDFAKTLDTDEQYTALIVQGGSPEFQNGGFEDGTFIEWASYARGNISSDQVHSGSYSAYFTEGGNYINDTGFYFKTGARYKSTIWVKNERDADITVTGAYQYETTSDGWKTKTVSGATLSVPNDGEWHEFTFDFLPDVQPQTRIRPVWSFGSLSVESNHRVYVDDADFTRLDGEDSIVEDPLDLSHIPDGVTSYDSDIVKKGDVLYSISYVQRYGYKEKVYSDDTITDEQKLLEEGIKQLRKLMAPVVTIDVKAVDLSLYIQGYTHLRIGEAVRVRSAVHDVDEYLMVSSIDLDLQDPGQTDYTLGTSYDTLTGQQSGYLKSLNAGINHSLDSVASLDQELKDQAVQIGGISDVADDAKEIADNANQTAQNAQNSADNALNKAEEVEDTVNGIQIIIDQIDADVEQAKQDAADAKADVAEAASKADAAAEKADAAAEKADSYQQQITDVTTTVNGVVQEVEGYTALIQGAVEDASGALSAATAAQADIDGFKTTVSQTYQTKSDAADAMEQEVLNRNSAIEQSAEGILQQVSESYVNNETGETLATKAELSQTASGITQSVSETYQVKGDYLTEGQAAEVYASKAELSTTADAITATVEEKFDDSLLVKEADGGVIDCGDTAGMPLAGLTVYGQTRHNLWVNPRGSSNGITLTPNSNGSVTISGTSSSGNIWIGYSERYILKPGRTYTLSIDKSTTNSKVGFRVESRVTVSTGTQSTQLAFVTDPSSPKTFTVPSNSEYCNFLFTCSETALTVSGTYRVMLNEGETAEPWCPPGLNSVEDVTVWQSGGNFAVFSATSSSHGVTATFDDEGYLNVTGTPTINSAFGWDNKYIVDNIPAGTKITASFTGTQGPVYMGFNYTLHSSTSDQATNCYVGGTQGNNKTFTVPEGLKRIFWFIGVQSGNQGKAINAKVRFSLSFGEEPIDEKAVAVTSTPIDLLGNKVSSLPDGTRDELVVDAGGNVVLRKKTASFIAPSSESSWGFEADNHRISIGLEIPAYFFINDSHLHAFCDKLPLRSSGFNSARTETYLSTVNLYAQYGDSTSKSTMVSRIAGAEYIYRVEESLVPLGTVDLPDPPETNAHVWISTGTQGLDPDIHATWYGENASPLKNFASKAELKVESDQIKATVEETYSTKEEVSTTYATKSEVTQTANSIKSEVSETYTTKTEFNGLEVGGRNLILDSYIDETSGLYGFAGRSLSIDLVAGETYAFYANGRVINGSGRLTLYVHTPSWSASQNISTFSKTDTTFGKIFTAYVSGRYAFSAYSYLSSGTAGGDVHLNWVKLEKGTKPTDWSPAPEDIQTDLDDFKDDVSATYATKTSVSTVEQTVDSLTSTVSSNYKTLNDKFGSYYTKTQVDQKEDAIQLNAQRMAGINYNQAKMLYTDPCFEKGMNGVKFYNNANNGNVTITRQSGNSSDPFTFSNYRLMIQNKGSSTPGCGGFYFGNQSRANAVFLYRIWALIPTGRNISWGSNSFGTGSNVSWLSSTAGTGAFEEYVCVATCGSTGEFSSIGYFYIDGAVGTSSSPVTWYVAYATCFDVTNKSDYSTLRVDVDGIEGRVVDAEGNISSLEQTSSGLELRLTQAEKDVDTAQSTANTAKTAANNAAKTATNYLKFDSSGLVVGNHTGTLQGNVLLNSSGMQVRKGSTVLANYGAALIELGKNSKTSVIQFSNNQGFLRATGTRAIQIGSGTPSSMGGALTFGDSEGSALFNGYMIGKCGSHNYEMYAGRVIFSGTATTGNVTLSESAANFDYITIFVRTNDNYYGSTTVWAPNGKSVALSVAFTNNASYGGAGMYVKTRTVSISGTAIANVNYGYGTTRHDAYCTAAYANSYIYIYQVVGYK